MKKLNRKVVEKTLGLQNLMKKTNWFTESHLNKKKSNLKKRIME